MKVGLRKNLLQSHGSLPFVDWTILFKSLLVFDGVRLLKIACWLRMSAVEVDASRLRFVVPTILLFSFETENTAFTTCFFIRRWELKVLFFDLLFC